MKFDVFFSICQTPVDGDMPTERRMWENFFDQVRWADQLGFDTAWVAETHLSCQVQKQNPQPVIPQFEGEIGLNTDILQLAHVIFAQTKNINVGSAIRNIQSNGGPIAHAEAVRTFLSLHALKPNEKRLLYLGFAAGRFPFSNIPYGIRPRNGIEERAWTAVRGKIFQQAVEIFLRFLRGDVFSSREITPQFLTPRDFRNSEDWVQISALYTAIHGQLPERIAVEPVWTFDKVGVIPFEAPMDNLRLIIGAHDAPTQIFANQFLPVGVFNLSITPGAVIEETHKRMQTHFHAAGGPWSRDHMPRTVLVFINDTPGLSEAEKNQRAQEEAEKAMVSYWQALEGTVIPERIAQAVDNALVGSPERIVQQMRERFHREDRLMLWFDFHSHDNEHIKRKMQIFWERVKPQLEAM